MLFSFFCCCLVTILIFKLCKQNDGFGEAFFLSLTIDIFFTKNPIDNENENCYNEFMFKMCCCGCLTRKHSVCLNFPLIIFPISRVCLEIPTSSHLLLCSRKNVFWSIHMGCSLDDISRFAMEFRLRSQQSLRTYGALMRSFQKHLFLG